jgi:NTP pyrophosphatase (non-canonical NTP hydrolase)
MATMEGFQVELQTYQQRARQTDQRPGTEPRDLIVHLLGLVGEVGSVATEYKKWLRDGEAHRAAKSRMREELGDVLWYAATVATKFDLDLEDIAVANLERTADRWLILTRHQDDLFDEIAPEHERLPRRARFDFVTERNTAGRAVTRVLWDGRQVGDALTDCSQVSDGYRFHDVFHIAHAAVLGWSPVLRKLLGVKRRSDPRIDEAEDGGRAIVIEEGVAALVFAYATSHDYLRGVTRLDHTLLDTIRNFVSHLEVSVRSAADWERAILAGYAAWNHLCAHDGGSVLLNMEDGRLEVVKD